MQELTLEWKIKRNIQLNGKLHTVEIGQDHNGDHYAFHSEEPRFWISDPSRARVDKAMEEILKVFESLS